MIDFKKALIGYVLGLFAITGTLAIYHHLRPVDWDFYYTGIEVVEPVYEYGELDLVSSIVIASKSNIHFQDTLRCDFLHDGVGMKFYEQHDGDAWGLEPTGAEPKLSPWSWEGVKPLRAGNCVLEAQPSSIRPIMSGLFTIRKMHETIYVPFKVNQLPVPDDTSDPDPSQAPPELDRRSSLDL